MNIEVVLPVLKNLLNSFVINCELFVLTLLFGLPLGLLIAFGTMSRYGILRKPIKFFIWIIRGTPLMLQIIVIFYMPTLLFDTVLWGSGYTGRFLASAIAFIINYACYFSEIFRGGIESMAKGQREAGQVLGMTKAQIFFKITLLQVIKRILAPMGNEIITLIKDTSLARVIANQEIIMVAQNYASSSAIIWPLFSTALFFLAAVGILTLLLNYSERKLSYFV